MDKVYIVEGGFDYEGFDILGVYANKDDADAHCAKVQGQFDYTQVTEHEVK